MFSLKLKPGSAGFQPALTHWLRKCRQDGGAPRHRFSLTLCLLAFSLAPLASQAQDGSPIPGASGLPPGGGRSAASSARFAAAPTRASAGQLPALSGPLPGAAAPDAHSTVIYAPPPSLAQVPAPAGGAPVPGQIAAARRGMTYGDLPMNPDDAKASIIELNGMKATARPQELLERVSQLCEWLGDMVEAHNRMANAFAKSPETKAQYLGEKQAAQRFTQLKHQAQLLKADLLIAMHRFPESLSPLVDIVIAEPTTTTGKAAYKRLQQLGFSQEVADFAAPAEKTATAAASSKSTASVSAVRKPTGAGPRQVAAPLPVVH